MFVCVNSCLHSLFLYTCFVFFFLHSHSSTDQTVCLSTEPPEWVFEPESQLSMVGSDVLIRCSATGTPKPAITWRVNGVLLQGQFLPAPLPVPVFCMWLVFFSVCSQRTQSSVSNQKPNSKFLRWFDFIKISFRKWFFFVVLPAIMVWGQMHCGCRVFTLPICLIMKGNIL